jgi:hypothetical protein
VNLGQSQGGRTEPGNGLGDAVEGAKDTVKGAGTQQALGAAGEVLGDVLDRATDEGAKDKRGTR